jgi:hypothetical protein
MDELDIIRLLDEQMESVYPGLRSYIRHMTSVRGLPAGYGDPDEIIHLAVGAMLRGERRMWDPSKHQLGGHLRSIVRSLLSDKVLYHKERNKALGRIAHGVDPQPEPKESALLSPEEAEERWNFVKEEIGEDGESLDYIAAIRLDLEPAEIAEMTGIPLARVYEIPRKLKKLGPAIMARMKASQGRREQK